MATRRERGPPLAAMFSQPQVKGRGARHSRPTAKQTAIVVVGFMNTSNEDKGEGLVKSGIGKVKEVAGRVVGDPEVEAEGTAEKTEGKVQQKVGEIKKVFGK